MQLNCGTKRKILNSEAWAQKGEEEICGQERKEEEEKKEFSLAPNLRPCPTSRGLESPQDSWCPEGHLAQPLSQLVKVRIRCHLGPLQLTNNY